MVVKEQLIHYTFYMKNAKPPDRRVQRTRQILLDALIGLILEKEFETITVQEIIDRANVGRATFYSHFRDKDDLLASGFESLKDVFEDFHYSSSAETSDWNFSLALFQHAEEQRSVFKALFGKQAGALILSRIQKALTVILKQHFQEMFKNKPQAVPLDVFVQYLVSAFLGLLTWWLTTDAAETAVQMNQYYRSLTEPVLIGLLANK